MTIPDRKCRECGNTFRRRQYNAEFCGTPCRQTFNNRRQMRGAVLYDLLMIGLADLEAFKRAGLDGRVDALLETWRAADAEKRTWKSPHSVRIDTAGMLR